ncbi:MAG: DUF6427 family protein [Weeksellaceae bacterium]|nr:DUF6427 family protein [Weeksellaceae bacterium]
MLVKILSQKSFLFQFFLGSAFLALLFLNIKPVEPTLYGISGIVLLLLTALIFHLFYTYSNLISQPTFGLWFYMIWLLVFSKISTDLPMTASLFITTIMFWRWISTTNTDENKRILFDSGFLLTTSTLLYPPSIFLILFLLISYMYTHTIGLKSILLLLIGMLLPVLIGIQLFYLTGHAEYLSDFGAFLRPNVWESPATALIPLGILLLLCWLNHLRNFSMQNIYKRHKYFLTFVYFVNWLLILIFYGGDNPLSLMFLGLPVSIFMSIFVQHTESNRKKEFWLWIYAVLMAVYFFSNELLSLYNSILGDVSFEF